MRMVVQKPDIKYRGLRMAVGEEFDCEDRHVHVMTLLGCAPVPGYATRVMQAARASVRARKKR